MRLGTGAGTHLRRRGTPKGHRHRLGRRGHEAELRIEAVRLQSAIREYAGGLFETVIDPLVNAVRPPEFTF